MILTYISVVFGFYLKVRDAGLFVGELMGKIGMVPRPLALPFVIKEASNNNKGSISLFKEDDSGITYNDSRLVNFAPGGAAKDFMISLNADGSFIFTKDKSCLGLIIKNMQPPEPPEMMFLPCLTFGLQKNFFIVFDSDKKRPDIRLRFESKGIGIDYTDPKFIGHSFDTTPRSKLSNFLGPYEAANYDTSDDPKNSSTKREFVKFNVFF